MIIQVPEAFLPGSPFSGPAQPLQWGSMGIQSRRKTTFPFWIEFQLSKSKRSALHGADPQLTLLAKWMNDGMNDLVVSVGEWCWVLWNSPWTFWQLISVSWCEFPRVNTSFTGLPAQGGTPPLSPWGWRRLATLFPRKHSYWNMNQHITLTLSSCSLTWGTGPRGGDVL